MTIKQYEKDGQGGLSPCVNVFGTEVGDCLRNWTQYDSPIGTQYLAHVLGADYVEDLIAGESTSFWLVGNQAQEFGKMYAFDHAPDLEGKERSVFEDIFRYITDPSAVHYLWHFIL